MLFHHYSFLYVSFTFAHLFVPFHFLHTHTSIAVLLFLSLHHTSLTVRTVVFDSDLNFFSVLRISVYTLLFPKNCFITCTLFFLFSIISYIFSTCFVNRSESSFQNTYSLALMGHIFGLKNQAKYTSNKNETIKNKKKYFESKMHTARQLNEHIEIPLPSLVVHTFNLMGSCNALIVLLFFFLCNHITRLLILDCQNTQWDMCLMCAMREMCVEKCQIQYLIEMNRSNFILEFIIV